MARALGGGAARISSYSTAKQIFNCCLLTVRKAERIVEEEIVRR